MNPVDAEVDIAPTSMAYNLWRSRHATRETLAMQRLGRALRIRLFWRPIAIDREKERGRDSNGYYSAIRRARQPTREFEISRGARSKYREARDRSAAPRERDIDSSRGARDVRCTGFAARGAALLCTRGARRTRGRALKRERWNVEDAEGVAARCKLVPSSTCVSTYAGFLISRLGDRLRVNARQVSRAIFSIISSAILR